MEVQTMFRVFVVVWKQKLDADHLEHFRSYEV